MPELRYSAWPENRPNKNDIFLSQWRTSSMTSVLISVGDWLKMTVARLNNVSLSPQLDAEVLLHAITGIHRAMTYARPEQLLTLEQVEDLQLVLTRRERGEPIAYITGVQEFWSMPLEVSPAVLIPRPETELLVERALELISLEHPSRVLDMGTGSGAIALAVAQARPHARVTAIDSSAEALAVAICNQRALQITNLKIQHSDWFSALRGERFDVIVSNPPYIAADDPSLSPAVAAFEPKLALIAGPTGLEALEHLIAEASNHLQPNGWVVLEHGWKQADAVATLLVKHGYSHVRSRPDLSGHDRVTEGQKP
jgi:release factor glutamine methyltransferase